MKKRVVEDVFGGLLDEDPFDGLLDTPIPIPVQPKRDIFGDVEGGVVKIPKMPMWPR